MSYNTLKLEARHSGDDVANLTLPHSSDISRSIQDIGRYVAGYGTGAYRGELEWRTGATRASATLTFASTGPADTQAGTICNQTFTAKTTPAGAGDFQRSDTPSVVAAALAAAINASASAEVTDAVTASADGAVVTITAKDEGALANALQIAVGTWANTTLSSNGFTGGSNGTATVLSAGGV